MIPTPPRRGRHRKRLSALRLSTDSTVSTLPAYTSPPWNQHPELGDVSDRPPDYPDSAEEGDADTDTDDAYASLVYKQPAPLPRRPRRSPPSRTIRRQPSESRDPYLDALLERSVHALEMSNTLLQSSMSTQSSLSAVLSSDSVAERSLEARAHILSSRIFDNRDLHDSWMDDLDEISRGVDNLVGEQPGAEAESEDTVDEHDIQLGGSVSKSLPTSGFAERVRKGHMRRPSLDLRSASTHLQYSNHERSHFVAPPPRALTMYVDSSDDPDLISLPPTLGLRSTSHLPPTPLPSQTFSPSNSDLPSSESGEHTQRAVDVLSSYVRSPPSGSSTPSSIASTRMPISTSTRSRRSSSNSSGTINSFGTIRRIRHSKSPPPPLSLKSPSPSRSASTSNRRSRSTTPLRSSSPPRHSRPMTPPIEELSASSTSSSSDSMHVDLTVQSLRQILINQPRAPSAGSSSSVNRNKADVPPPLPRPSLLQPSAVSPAAGTSTATASISRLFTKARHSTRPPSPPRQSSLKNRSTPPTPVLATPPDLHSLHIPPSLLSAGLRSPTSSSGRSTPKRISFAELPESYANSKPDGASRFRDKARDRDKKGKGKGKRAGGKDAEREDALGWWTGWLLGAAGTNSGAGLSVGAAREERYARSPTTWATRPGYGNSLEDWGA